MKQQVSAIILAAGSGRRMNNTQKKQFMKLADKPVLYYSIKAFEQSCVDEIILVLNKEDIPYCKEEIVNRYGFHKVTAYVQGGDQRLDSVEAGVKACEGDFCMIHDAARPLITTEQINDMIPKGIASKACIQAVLVKDTIKLVSEQHIVETPPRSMLYAAQTPQMFERALLKEAYERLHQQNVMPKQITDDAMLVQMFTDHPVDIVPGAYENIKITTPEDLKMAEFFLQLKLPS